MPTDRLTRQVLASDVVLIATPDSAIVAVAAELAHLGGNEWRGKVVLHTSGALDSSVLRALAERGRGDRIDPPDADVQQPGRAEPCGPYVRD